MKIRILLLLGVSAIASFSFTLSFGNKTEKSSNKVAVEVNQKEPIGGLVSEDKF
jgi:hypothetical protein